MPATYDTLTATPAMLRGWIGPIEEWVAPGAHSFSGHWAPTVWGYVPHEDAIPKTRRLNLHRPESLHRLADWLAAGERCSLGCTGAVPDGGCPRCGGTGHLRPPSPMWWALPREIGGTLPALWSRQVLGWSVESVGRGGRAIRGVLPAWTTDEDGTAYRLSNPYEWTTRADAAGWACSPGWDIDGVAGPETGPEGRTRADAAALDSLYALAPAGEDEPLTLPPLATETTT